jgi:hypothetical protein
MHQTIPSVPACSDVAEVSCTETSLVGVCLGGDHIVTLPSDDPVASMGKSELGYHATHATSSFVCHRSCRRVAESLCQMSTCPSGKADHEVENRKSEIYTLSLAFSMNWSSLPPK